MPISKRLLAKFKADATAPALEVLNRLYATLLAMPEFTLKDGSKASVSAYDPPSVDEQGETRCGIDVDLENGSHLEFTVHNSGWGRFVADRGAEKKPTKGRGR